MSIRLTIFLALFSLAITSACPLFAQKSLQNFFHPVKQYVLPNELGGSVSDNIYKYYDGKCFVSGPASEIYKDGYFYLTSISEKETKKYKLWIPQTDWFFSFTVNGSYIALLAQNNIFIYDTKKGEYLRSIDVDLSYNKIDLYNGKIFLSSSCYTCMTPGVLLAVYDFKTGKLLSSKEIRTFPGYQLLSFAPREVVDVCGGKFVVSDITRYNVRILDENFKLRQTLSNPDCKWNNENLEKTLSKYNTRDMEKMFSHPEVTDKWTDEHNLIVRTEFYNNNTILVLRNSYSSTREFCFDIWKFSRGKWYLHAKDLQQNDSKKSNKVTWNNLDVYPYSYSLNRNCMIIPSSTPFYIKKYIDNKKTYSEFSKDLDKYYNNHKLGGSIYLFKEIVR